MFVVFHVPRPTTGSSGPPSPRTRLSMRWLEPCGVPRDVAARRATLRAPARTALAAAVVLARRVEAQARDHGVGVTGVGVDRDPLALARLAPALEARRVERALEQAAAVHGVAHRARAVVARVLPLAVPAAVLVRLVRDPVGRGDGVLHLLRRRVRCDRRPTVSGDRRALRRVALGGLVLLAAVAA